MTNGWRGGEILPVTRMKTGVPGLDAVLGGGLPAGRTCLIAGPPGTGKTTLGNQLAFAHAAAGGLVVFATLLAEAHDVMLQNIRDFTFFDRSLPGDRVRYLNLLSDLEEGGLDRVAATIRREIRESGTNLLIVDGIGVIDDVAVSSLDVRHFAQQLDALAGLLGCTTVLLSDPGPGEARRLGAQLNGMVLLTNEREGARNVRLLEVAKLRGAHHVGGTHEFAINESGVTIYPRLESLSGQRRAEVVATDGLGTGVAALDTMLGGGLKPLSSTMVLGTPGAGKTLLGLTFLAEGARNGERGLMASFHEPPQAIATTADRIGLDLTRHIDAGMVRILWNPPLELSVDAWAWQLLEVAARDRPQRVFIDALTDVQQF
ncbi:MAG TPA: ATPase domain-containing protein, partial [Thermomicrobiales bacterium]|nr:ATPase domain-containing protein [Thermomicrobiales bacterium]